MTHHLDRLRKIFEELDHHITETNEERRENGGPKVPRAGIRILGQMSLLTNEEIAARIDLLETADLDALVDTEYVVFRKLRELLRAAGLVYDETSSEVWIPPNSRFEPLFDLPNVRVERIDAESALVSKAVKAREKNRILIQEAIAAEAFPKLADRIEAHGGDLGFFLEAGK